MFVLSVNTHVAMHRGSGGAFKKATAGRDKVGDGKRTRNDGNGEAALGGASMASPSVSSRTGTEAVVFSIQFYGKTIGEVGLMDQDLSELDWTRFKSYIVSIVAVRCGNTFVVASSRALFWSTFVSGWRVDIHLAKKFTLGLLEGDVRIFLCHWVLTLCRWKLIT